MVKALAGVGQQVSAVARQRTQVKPGDFAAILAAKQEGVKFSAHAQRRLATRNIPLSPQDLAQLNQAVDKAAQKGARDSLILMKDLAFVVSVTNRTVVTALDERSMKENVFTNIDSAVIL